MDVNEYFRSETNARFDRLESQVSARFDRLDDKNEEINAKMGQLFEFRATVRTDSRWVSAITGGIVSLIIGLITAWAMK